MSDFPKEKANALVIALLDDDHGVSSEAYELLKEFMKHYSIDGVADRVDAVDGRFFLPDDFFNRPIG